MVVDLKPETERLVQEQVERGHFCSVDDVITHAVAALYEPSPRPSDPPKPKMPLGQFLLESPLRNSGLKLERQQDYPRPVEL